MTRQPQAEPIETAPVGSHSNAVLVVASTKDANTQPKSLAAGRGSLMETPSPSNAARTLSPNMSSSTLGAHVRSLLYGPIVLRTKSRPFGDDFGLWREDENHERYLGGWLTRKTGKRFRMHILLEDRLVARDPATGELETIATYASILSVTPTEQAGPSFTTSFAIKIDFLKKDTSCTVNLRPKEGTDERSLCLRWVAALQLRSKSYRLELDEERERFLGASRVADLVLQGGLATFIRRDGTSQEASTSYGLGRIVRGVLDDAQTPREGLKRNTSSSGNLDSLLSLRPSSVSNSARMLSKYMRSPSSSPSVGLRKSGSSGKLDSPDRASTSARAALNFNAGDEPSQGTTSPVLKWEDEMWENQRWVSIYYAGSARTSGSNWGSGWSAQALLPTERGAFTDRLGWGTHTSLEEVPVPSGFKVSQGWYLDLSGADLNRCNNQGWTFSITFQALESDFASGQVQTSPSARWLVRRRRWLRTRVLDESDANQQATLARVPPSNVTHGWLGTLWSSQLGVWHDTYVVILPQTEVRPAAVAYFKRTKRVYRPDCLLNVSWSELLAAPNEHLRLKYLDNGCTVSDSIATPDNPGLFCLQMSGELVPRILNAFTVEGRKYWMHALRTSISACPPPSSETLAHRRFLKTVTGVEVRRWSARFSKSATSLTQKLLSPRSVPEEKVFVEENSQEDERLVPFSREGPQRDTSLELARQEADDAEEPSAISSRGRPQAAEAMKARELREAMRRQHALLEQQDASSSSLLERRISLGEKVARTSTRALKAVTQRIQLGNNSNNNNASKSLALVVGGEEDAEELGPANEDSDLQSPASPNYGDGGDSSYVSPAADASDLPDRANSSNAAPKKRLSLKFPGSSLWTSSTMSPPQEEESGANPVRSPTSGSNLKRRGTNVLKNPVRFFMSNNSSRALAKTSSAPAASLLHEPAGGSAMETEAVDEEDVPIAGQPPPATEPFVPPEPLENVLLEADFDISVDELDAMMFRELEYQQGLFDLEKMYDVVITPWTLGVSVGSELRRAYKMPRVGFVPPSEAYHLLTRTVVAPTKGYALRHICDTPSLPFGTCFGIEIQYVLTALSPSRVHLEITMKALLRKSFMAWSYVRTTIKRELTTYHLPDNFWMDHTLKFMKKRFPSRFSKRVRGLPDKAQTDSSASQNHTGTDAVASNQVLVAKDMKEVKHSPFPAPWLFYALSGLVVTLSITCVYLALTMMRMQAQLEQQRNQVS